jgi:urease accessory protein
VTTSILVEQRHGRHRARFTSGLLRAQLLHGPDDRCRVGLLATTALLLGGDQVELEIVVGEDATLELLDVAGTVAYHGRGATSGWQVRLQLEAGARLRWSGEPLVVSYGARVIRSLDVDLAASSSLMLRETVVLGRSGEPGGRCTSRTAIRRTGQDLLVETLDLDAVDLRRLPGMLGRHRVVDTIVALGLPEPRAAQGAARFRLVEPGCTVTRYLGQEVSRSPLHDAWRDFVLPLAEADAQDQPALR